MNTIEAIKRRRSIRHFQTDFKIPNEDIDQLVKLAMLSPTSYNIQHWKFLVVENPEIRQKLQSAAYGQGQVTEASHLILVITDVKAWKKNMKEKWKNVPKEVGDFMSSSAPQFYEGREELQRDEAIRSASFATQTLLLAATEMGYETGTMIGFDFEEAAKIIHLPKNHIISNFIVIGKGVKEAMNRGGQLPLKEVMIKDTF